MTALREQAADAKIREVPMSIPFAKNSSFDSQAMATVLFSRRLSMSAKGKY